jgi:predicted nuclease with TOPRIM domain
MILGLAIFFFCKYLQWKRYWKQDSEYYDGQLNEEQNANVSLMNENTELKDRLKNMAVDSDLYNHYWHEAEVINSCLQEKLKIAENRTASVEGKLKKLNTRVMAWELTAKFRPVNTEELDTIHEKIWNDIKTY